VVARAEPATGCDEYGLWDYGVATGLGLREQAAYPGNANDILQTPSPYKLWERWRSDAYMRETCLVQGPPAGPLLSQYSSPLLPHVPITQ
jgi:hypothetical protein